MEQILYKYSIRMCVYIIKLQNSPVFHDPIHGMLFLFYYYICLSVHIVLYTYTHNI